MLIRPRPTTYSGVPTNRDIWIGTAEKIPQKVILRRRITLLSRLEGRFGTFRKSYSSRLVGTLLYVLF